MLIGTMTNVSRIAKVVLIVVVTRVTTMNSTVPIHCVAILTWVGLMETTEHASPIWTFTLAKEEIVLTPLDSAKENISVR